MNYSSNKEVKALLRAVKKIGLRIEKQGSGHISIHCPSGKRIYMSSTPRSNDSIKRTIRALEKEGIDVK